MKFMQVITQINYLLLETLLGMQENLQLQNIVGCEFLQNFAVILMLQIFTVNLTYCLGQPQIGKLVFALELTKQPQFYANAKICMIPNRLIYSKNTCKANN